MYQSIRLALLALVDCAPGCAGARACSVARPRAAPAVGKCHGRPNGAARAKNSGD